MRRSSSRPTFLSRTTALNARRRPRRDDRYNIRPLLEQLESRLLLSVTTYSDDEHYLATGAWEPTPDALEAEGAVQIHWQGDQTYAKQSQWIVQFSDVHGSPQEQMQQIQDRLHQGDWVDQGMEMPVGPNLKVVDHLGSAGLVLLQAEEPDLAFEQLYNPLLAMPGVEYVEPNFVDLQQTSTFPNDPSFSFLWGLHNTGLNGKFDADIDAPEAWDLTTGSKDIVVAVIDSGVDYTHPDLAANMWKNPGEIPGNKVDDDGNGFVDDVYGYDFINGDSDPRDDNNHGTHVAGTIAALGNNLLGVVGVGWNIQVMALKFLGSNGRGPTSAAVAAVNYVTMMARDYGVNVVLTSNSWGGGGYSTALYSAIANSAAENMLFVASAGNDSRNTDFSPAYPASYNLDNIISVAATDRYDNRAYFSNYGAKTVDLAAPGVSILSTTRNGGYGYKSGTSMAAPHVSGAAALAWSIAPDATYQEVRDAIFQNVDPVPSMSGITVTGGRLNAHKSLLSLGYEVRSSSPGPLDKLTEPPTEFVLNFRAAYDPSSVDAGDLTVNGIPADTVTLTDDDTLTFSYVSSPMVSQGLQTMAIAAGSVRRLSDGRGIKEWSSQFRYDALPMEVISTSPALASIATLPLSTIQLHLNEALDPASLDAGDLSVSQGTVVGHRVVDEDSIEFDVAGLDEEGTLTLTVPAGALLDTYGNPARPFSGSIELDVDILPFPTPLEPIQPLGSLIYDPIRRGIIGVAGDRDSFTIALDPGQTLTVVVTPSGSLQPAIEVVREGSDAAPVQSTASAPGGTVVLQNIPIQGKITATGREAEVFKVTVAGATGSTGVYSLQLILNAGIEQEQHGGTANGDQARAQGLDRTFLPLLHAVGDDEDSPDGEGQAYRGAVLGSIVSGKTATVPSKTANTEGDWGNAWPFNLGQYGVPGMRYQQIYARTDFATAGLVDELRFRRDRNAPPFAAAGLDVQINLGYAATSPSSASRVFADNIGSDYVTVFDGLLELSSSGHGSPNPFDIVIDVDDKFEYDPSRGDLLLDIRMRNSVTTAFFDASGYQQQSSTQRIYSTDLNAASGVVGLLPYGLVTRFEFVADEDWYSFGLAAGETASVHLTTLEGSEAAVELYDDQGTRLALGIPDPENRGKSISSFLGTGEADNTSLRTYYVRVTAGDASQYSLLVTKNVMFETESNDDFTTAIPLISSQTGGRRWALGHVGDATGSAVIDATDSGWWNSRGEHNPFNLNYNAAWYGGPRLELRNFFTFDLGAVHRQIGGAELHLTQPSNGYHSPDDSETFNVYDVSTSLTALTAGGFGQTSIFDDLGTGALFASREIARSDAGTDVRIPLNQDGIEALNGALGGQLALGGAVTSLAKGTPNESVFASTSKKGNRQLHLTFIDKADYFSVSIDANQTLMIETETPAGGDGELVNSLDPMIRLYNSRGDLVASDDNSGNDGRNAQLRYRIPSLEGGTYFIEVLPSDSSTAATNGEYILSVQHSTGELPPFTATASDPPDGLRTRDIPEHVTVDYNDNVLLPTAQASDLQIAGIPAQHRAVINGNTISYKLPGHVFHWDALRGGNGHYYMTTTAALTWQQAEDAAQAAGGHLVSINSADEHDLLKHHFLSGGHNKNVYWIGLTDRDAEGTFTWSSGEPVTYTAWHSGEPNNWGGNEDYGVMNWHYAGNWSGAARGSWNDDNGQSARLAIFEFETLPADVWVATDGRLSFSSSAGAITDTQNTPLAEFHSAIDLDLTAPRVVAAVPQANGVMNPGDLEIVVTFSEPIATAKAGSADLRLRGLFRGSDYQPVDMNFNDDGTVLTLAYSNLPDDRYELTLFSGTNRFQDVQGWALDGEGGTAPSGNGFEGGDFQLAFALDPASGVAFPPVEAKMPLGSLIYDPSVDGTIAYHGDVDEVLIDLDAGQSLTVVIQREGSLWPSVDVRDPLGTLLHTATAEVGATALRVIVPIETAGLHTIAVHSADGSMGLYDVRVILNADLESELLGPHDNNSLANAHNLEPSFIPLLKNADRGAVLGRVDAISIPGGTTPDAYGYTATPVAFEFEDIGATGREISFGWFKDDGYAQLSSSQLSGFEFDFYGKSYSQLFVSTNGLISFDAGNSFPWGGDLRTFPTQPTIAALWQDLDASGPSSRILWEVRGSGDQQRLIIQWDEVYYSRWYYSWHQPITFQLVLNEADDSVQFNYLDLQGGAWWRDEGARSTVGVKGEGWQLETPANRILLVDDNGPNQFVGSGKSTRIARERPAPDFYSFELQAGQKVTIAMTPQDRGDVMLELQNAAGTTLMIGAPASTNVGSVISNFTAAESGTYYIRANGDEGLDYSLVITRDSVFDTEDNSSIDTAQDFAGLHVALGHLGSSTTPSTIRVAVHANGDHDWYSNMLAQQVVDQLNDSTAFDIKASVRTNSQLDTVDELQMFDVVLLGATYWFRAFPVNVASSIRQWVESGQGGVVAAGTLYRQLTYWSTPLQSRLDLDAVVPLDMSLTYVPSFWGPLTVTTVDHPATAGLSTAPVYGFGGETSHTGADPGAVVLGLDYAGRPAITVSGPNAPRGAHLAPDYWFNVLRAPGSFGDQLLEQTVVWAAPPLPDTSDIYYFEATDGETLDLFTITPGDGPGEFDNILNPRLTLYNASGAVVATGVAGTDGRNEQILYTVPSGSGGRYYIQVTSEDGTTGEYVLDPISVSAELSAPLSASGLTHSPDAYLAAHAAESLQTSVGVGSRQAMLRGSLSSPALARGTVSPPSFARSDVAFAEEERRAANQEPAAVAKENDAFASLIDELMAAEALTTTAALDEAIVQLLAESHAYAEIRRERE